MAVTLALLLDALLGEPRWLWDRAPHPAVLMGRLIGWLDAWLNQGTARRAKGVFALCLLVALGLALGRVRSSSIRNTDCDAEATSTMDQKLKTMAQI